MADDTEDTAPDTTLDNRVGKLEAGQESLSAKLDKVLEALSGGGQQDDGEPQGAPNVAAEIRQQLEERDRKDKAAARDKAREDRLTAAETKLAELAEKPPGPMPRRVEKIMGWH